MMGRIATAIHLDGLPHVELLHPYNRHQQGSPTFPLYRPSAYSSGPRSSHIPRDGGLGDRGKGNRQNRHTTLSRHESLSPGGSG